MVTGTVTITNETGIHTRPGNELIKYIKGFEGITVEIEKDSKKVKASSLLQVMSLGVKKGDSLTVHVDGQKEQEVLDHVLQFLKELKD